MKPAPSHRHLVWQSIVCFAVIASAIAYAIVIARQPLAAADLAIAAQQLHSYAVEGMMLAEQASLDNVYSHYLESEAQFLDDKVSDIARMLRSRDHSAERAGEAKQALAAAHALRDELNSLRIVPNQPQHLDKPASQLRQLAIDMHALAKRLSP
jgi:hypothetical protein